MDRCQGGFEDLGGWIRLWWEDAGRRIFVAAETQAENARLGLGEDAGR
jgi:hypothetical protein